MKIDAKPPPCPSMDVRYGRIIRRATEAFLLNGYAATSVEDIAIEAGVSKPTIYRLVTDKYGLANAVLQGVADSLESDCRKAIDMEAPLEDCLVKFTVAYISWMKKKIGKAHNYDYLRLLMEMSGTNPEFSNRWIEASRRSVVIPLTEYISQRIKLGDFEPEEPIFIASQFIKSAYQSAQSVLSENIYNEDLSLTRRKVRMFLRGSASDRYKARE
jgi:TetR/AcrR family transcriptional repressor of mexJK operon